MGETLARKATRKIEYDRLSSLPDDVLQRILSFLDMKDVFLTKKLSRKWWKLSTSVSNLNFNSPKHPSEEAGFIRFVSLALIHNTAPKINKFRLCFNYQEEHLSAVNSWITFAMNKGVQELDLEFDTIPHLSDTYQLPSMLLKCETMMSLKLKNTQIKVSNFSSFPNLTAVSLKLDEIGDGLIEKLLEGCPQLENLFIKAFYYGPSIKIRSSSSSSLRLKHLRMEGQKSQNSSVDVEAPSLEILEIDCTNLGKYSFKDMPFLREAYLNVSCPQDSEHMSSLELLLLKLCHARVLKLSSTCIQVLSNRESKDPMVKLKHLILDSGLTVNELIGIAYMLKNSLELEALVIKIVPSHLKFDRDYDFVTPDLAVEHWEDSLSPFSCHLKTIKILDRGAKFCMSLYKRSTNASLEEEHESSEIQHGIAFLKGLLKAVATLKKLTIVISKEAYAEEPEEPDAWSLVLREVPNIIHRFPRSSSIVDVSVIEG